MADLRGARVTDRDDGEGIVESRTHLAIDPDWVGRPTALGPGTASARLVTTSAMAADDRGLCHGGFVFGLADYAAMLAVNDPNVVLGAAELRFVAPVRVGQTVDATATVIEEGGRKRKVEVRAAVGDTVVLTGTMTAFVLDRHVLDAG
ncbi:MAG: thioesterase family protein [Alphaproteobacteria bacterium]|nr:thioesterase family protein [Alphaproteobacteria bacterium]